MKSIMLSTAVAVMTAIAAPAFAVDEVNVSNGMSAGGAPLAVHGADPVALLTEGRPVDGSANFSATYGDASYYFASKENMETFQANPTKYLPQHGGFCSYGVAVGKKFDGDPDKFVIHDGKLFLFLNDQTRDAFLKDLTGTIHKADSNWVDIKHIAVGEL